MPTGLFSRGKDCNLDHQIFVDEKSDYFSFANMMHNVKGMKVCAQAQTDQPQILQPASSSGEKPKASVVAA